MARDAVTLALRPAWQAAARYTGRPVAAWIAAVVEDYLRNGAGRFFPLLPLDWHREGFKAIRTDDGKTYGPHDVRGLVACCFGIYRGCYLIRDDPAREPEFTLAHVPTGRRLAVLDRVRSCKRLAEVLAPLRMGWHEIDPGKVCGADVERFNALVAEYERAALPLRLRDDRDRPHAGVGGGR